MCVCVLISICVEGHTKWRAERYRKTCRLGQSSALSRTEAPFLSWIAGSWHRRRFQWKKQIPASWLSLSHMASPSFSQPRASVLPFGREKKEPAIKQNPRCRVRHRWIGTRPKVYIRDANARTPMCMLQSGVSYWTILACPKSDSIYSICSILIALAWRYTKARCVPRLQLLLWAASTNQPMNKKCRHWMCARLCNGNMEKSFWNKNGSEVLMVSAPCLASSLDFFSLLGLEAFLCST